MVMWSLQLICLYLLLLLYVRMWSLQLISAKTLLTHAGGLSGLYEDILRFIPEVCSLLLEISSPPSAPPSAPPSEGGVAVGGFDFLVNSMWPEVVLLLEKKTSVIFAPGNPDAFHKVNYTSLWLTELWWFMHIMNVDRLWLLSPELHLQHGVCCWVWRAVCYSCLR